MNLSALGRSALTALAILGMSAALAQDDKPDDKAPPKGKAGAAPAAPEAPPPDDYRQFFKKPQTPAEFWNALQFELDVGRLDLAAAQLHGLIQAKPTARELFALVDKHGLNAMLRLRNIRPWLPVPPYDEKPYQAEIAKLIKDREDVAKIEKVRQQQERAQKAHDTAIKVNTQAYADVEALITAATEALKKTLTDPERIRKYVGNLTATPEEAQFALVQLSRSGAAVAPFLLEAIKGATPAERPVLVDALRRLRDDILPPLAAALDSDDTHLKLDLIDTFQKRGAQAMTPHLWFLAASPAQPAPVRAKAIEALAELLQVPQSKLPLAKAALTREAERYYRHQAPFADPKAVTVWRYNGKTIEPVAMPATNAEEYYGLRFAGQALALDPSYEPAQITLLSLALEKAMDQAAAGQPLFVANPAMHELLATVNPDLVNKVLDRALAERRLGVILGAIRALGESSETRATRPTGRGQPPLLRALHYPDRRVQMAAAEALTRAPGAPAPEAAARTVDILRRVLAGELSPAKAAGRVLVAYFDNDQGDKVAAAVAQAGFEPVRARTGRELLRRLQAAADIDLLLIDAELPDPGLSSLLGQLRADQNASRLPTLLAAAPARADALTKFVERQSNITVIPRSLATDARELGLALKSKVADPAAAPVGAAEARDQAERAIRLIARISRGELPGYDFRPAGDAVLEVVRANRLSPEGIAAAAEAASRISGTRAQTVLADAAMDGARPPLTRFAAADALIRHIQQFGPLLSREQAQGLRAAHAAVADPVVKSRLAVVLGSLRPDARATGERLRTFRPAPPPAVAPPPPPKDKEAPKENDAGM